MRTGRNNKNGGFSLVELIIVVAIMAIVVGVIGLSVGTLTGRKTAKCADEIVSTLEYISMMIPPPTICHN